jgi:hypothetical protein
MAGEDSNVITPDQQMDVIRRAAGQNPFGLPNFRPVGGGTAAPAQPTNGIARVSTPSMPPVAAQPTQPVQMEPSASAARDAARHGASPTQTAAAASAAAKPVTPPPSPEDQSVTQAQQNIQRIQNEKAGLARLIPMTPMPQATTDDQGNVQQPSFWSKLGHGLLRGVEGAGRVGAQAVETAGNVFLPGVMANIPGTELHRDVEYQAGERRLSEAEKNRTTAQTGQQEVAKANLENEQAKQVGMLGAGKSDADQLVRDMMMGGPNNTPKVNPKTNEPFTLSEAMAEAHSQLKTAELPPDQQSFKNNPDLFAQSKARVDQLFPNATPQQRAAFYPSENMTPAQGDKLFDEARGVAQLNDAQQQRAFEQKRQNREDQEKKEANNVEWTENGHLMYGTQAEAEQRGAKWIKSKKGADDIRHDTALLNDMQAKLNDVITNRGALDQDGTQKAIIAKVLSTTGGGGITIGGQHIPLAPERGGAIDQLIQAGMLQGASDSTVNYIQSVLSFREAALALPKMITNSGRQSEVASRALWSTTPGLEPNSQYVLGQGRRFQGNIDRLRKTTPTITGEEASLDNPLPELQQIDRIRNPKTGETATWNESKKAYVSDKTGQVVK